MSSRIQEIEVVLGLLAAVAALAHLANKIRIAYPIVLVVAGVAIASIPGLPRVTLDPDTVFLVFLPPILFYGGLLTSWRDFRANLRPIMLLAVGLVAFTTVCVAVLVHWMIPGMGWPAAFALGAIVSPPDAASAAAICQRLRVPGRIVTILEGESLVNDATALVIYRFAIAAAVAASAGGKGGFSLGWASVQLVYVAGMGIGIGFAVGWAISWVRKRIDDHAIDNLIFVLTPFIAYLPAELAHCSGVLAAVVAGIVLGRNLPRVTTVRSRLSSLGVWDTLIFLLNGLLFSLIGLQLPVIIQNIAAASIDLSDLYLWGVVVALTCIITRFAWVFPGTYLPRLIKSIARTDPAPPVSWTVMVSWTGMRGIVSLAAAMALPVGEPEKAAPFPQRDLIIFLTFAVILATLVIQGLTLPALIRFLGLTDEGDPHHREERQARIEAAHAALSRLTVLSFDDTISPSVVSRVRAPYDERIAKLGGDPHDDLGLTGAQADEVLQRIHREALIAERKMVTFLRDQNVIGDEVLRRLIQEIDLDEAKLGDAQPE